jgi:zinc protease
VLCAMVIGLVMAEPNGTTATEIAPVKTVLPNGLTVIVLEQHDLPLVHIQALIKVGAAHDPPEKAGLANLTSSLLDEGTTTRSSKQIAEQIDFIGASLEIETSEDFTTASMRVLKKDVGLGFTFLSDMLLHPTFPQQEFERVRAQILGEIVSDNDDPNHLAMKTFHQLVFPNHPYQWPVTGFEDTVSHIEWRDVQHFYTREYLPNQTILVIVGDVTVEQATGLARTHFGSWKAGPAPVQPARKPPSLDKKVVRLIDKDLTQSTVVLGHGGINRTNPDFYAVTVMNHILGAGGFSSRLMDTVRDKQGLVYGITSHYDARAMPGPFWVSLQTKTDTTNQAVEAVLAEIKAMRDTPVSDQELAEAKAFLIGSFPLRFDTTAKLARLLAQVEFYGLGFEYFSLYPKLIERVTKEDVQRVAKQYLNPRHYALVVVGNLTKANVRH